MLELSWVAAIAASLLLGCAAETSDSSVDARIVTGASAPTIFGGVKDDDGSQHASAVVALRVGTGGTFELCSGALIAPNVVLTARHCVTKNITNSVSCDDNGRSANGPHVGEGEDPSTIGVYVGASPNFARRPTASARAIVGPSGPYLCDSDIALVILATPIFTVTPLPVRMHAPAQVGERIRAVGYGQNDNGLPIGTRFRKDGVSVLAQGKGISPSKTPLGPREFEVGKSICQGDSGGPAISEETGAVLGVVSRGGTCDEDFGHIYTTTAGFAALFEDAFKRAEASPTLEAGDINVNTRSKVTATNGTPESGARTTRGACSLGPSSPIASGAGTALTLLMAALGARGLRRRRAVGTDASLPQVPPAR